MKSGALVSCFLQRWLKPNLNIQYVSMSPKISFKTLMLVHVPKYAVLEPA